MTMTISRREFLQASAATGGGLALEFSFPATALAQAKAGAAPVELTAWILVHPDDRVTIRIARSEMGQGTLTGLAQLVSEELECDWSKVTVEFASVNRNIRENNVYRDMLTVGSRGIRSTADYVQQGGASARARLVMLDRMVAGVHFPTDVAAGFALGNAIADRMVESQAFKADYESAQAEWKR